MNTRVCSWALVGLLFPFLPLVGGSIFLVCVFVCLGCSERSGSGFLLHERRHYAFGSRPKRDPSFRDLIISSPLRLSVCFLCVFVVCARVACCSECGFEGEVLVVVVGGGLRLLYNATGAFLFLLLVDDHVRGGLRARYHLVADGCRAAGVVRRRTAVGAGRAGGGGGPVLGHYR